MELLCPNELPTIPVGRVYLITNLINGKRYVGITTRTLNKRYNEHFTNKKKPSQFVLQKACKKYGRQNFKMELIEELHDITEKDLFLKETFYIDKYNTFIEGGKGYNLVKQSDSKLVISEATRKKISKKSRGKNNGMYGKRHSEETRRKQGEGNKCRLGENHPLWKKHHTDKSKIKMSKHAYKMYNDKNIRFDPTIRNFKNIQEKKIFSGTQKDFRKKYKLDVGEVSRLCHGKAKSVHGWRLVEA